MATPNAVYVVLRIGFQAYESTRSRRILLRLHLSNQAPRRVHHRSTLRPGRLRIPLAYAEQVCHHEVVVLLLYHSGLIHIAPGRLAELNLIFRQHDNLVILHDLYIEIDFFAYVRRSISPVEDVSSLVLHRLNLSDLGRFLLRRLHRSFEARGGEVAERGHLVHIGRCVALGWAKHHAVVLRVILNRFA